MEMMKALSPWAEVDYEDAKGLTPRVDTLDGKRIGLFATSKGTRSLFSMRFKRN